MDRSITGTERFFQPDEIIVSKTDTTGRLTYANDVFLAISGYETDEVLGQPHNLIRHPHMPRAVFKLLWEHITSGREIFAYVVNRCKNGDHYWVLAHVTPNWNEAGQISGYHSCRRVPKRSAVDIIVPLYQSLRAIESQGDSKTALAQSAQALAAQVTRQGFSSYDRFILSLGR